MGTPPFKIMRGKTKPQLSREKGKITRAKNAEIKKQAKALKELELAKTKRANEAKMEELMPTTKENEKGEEKNETIVVETPVAALLRRSGGLSIRSEYRLSCNNK
jgi:hypothetical protein